MRIDNDKVTLNDVVDFYLYSYSLYKRKADKANLYKHPLAERVDVTYNNGDSSHFSTIVDGTSTNFSEYMLEIWGCYADEWTGSELDSDLADMWYQIPSLLDSICDALQYQNVTCKNIIRHEFQDGRYRNIYKLSSSDGKENVYIGQFGTGTRPTNLVIESTSILNAIERVVVDFECIKTF
jgi:hypothetical protein